MVRKLITLTVGLGLALPVAALAVIFTYTESDDSGTNIALGYPVPIPVASLTAVAGFRAYSELNQQHEALAMLNNNVEQRVAGKTLKGENLFVYLVGDANTVTAVDKVPESAVMIVGGTHAREWQTPEAVTEFFEQLVESGNDNHIGSFLRDNVNILVIPVLNIDGFKQTQAFPTQVTSSEATPRDGRMRRKNLRAVDGANTPVDGSLETTGDNLLGIDLNRNNPQRFGQNNGSSNDPTSLVYRGPNPASEPEIKALQQAATFGPAGRLRMYSDTHSFTKIFFTPMTGNSRRDQITTSLTNAMRLIPPSPYRFGPAQVGGGIGTTADWAAFTFQVPSWTLETEPRFSGADYGGTGASHSGFILPDAEIERVRDEIAKMYIFGSYRQAGPPSVRAAKIFDATSGDLVFSASWEPANGFARTMNVATNRAMVPGQRYTLWVAFDKPMRDRDSLGDTVQFQGQSIDIVPSIFLETPEGSPVRKQINITGSANGWLDTIGTAPDSALRYSKDAFRVDFEIPADLAGSGVLDMSLAIDTTDLSGLRLDANPQTVVDWRNGGWFNYEDSGFQDSIIGGVDCNFHPFIADEATAAAPSPSGDCRIVATAKEDSTSSTSASQSSGNTSAPAPSGGGGGGLLGLVELLLLLCLVAIFRTRN